MPQTPLCPGPLHTPTLQGWTPSFLRQHRETVPQAAFLSAHLSSSTPAKGFLSDLGNLSQGSYDKWFLLRLLSSIFTAPSGLSTLQICPVRRYALSSLLICLSPSFYFTPLELYLILNFLPFSLSSLLTLIFSLHCLSPPAGFSVSLSFCLYLCEYIYFALSLSLLTYCRRSE